MRLPLRSPRRWRPELLVALAVLAAGCGTALDPGIGGSGTLTESAREVGDFSSLSVGSAVEVTLTTGPESAVVVRADDNVQERIVTEVVDGELRIRLSGPVRNATLEAHVTVPPDGLDRVEADGAASVTSTETLEAATFTVDLSGATRAFLVVEAEAVEADVDGASVVNLSGKATDLVVRTSGASSVQLGELPVATADVEASGASRATVWVEDELRAVASGASTIRYRGEPDLDSDSSGGSTIGPE